MKKHISETEIFITYGDRSAGLYQQQLTNHIITVFGEDSITDPTMLLPIMHECYDWCAQTFQSLIQNVDDKLLLYYLFAYHESSIDLWIRVLNGEDLHSEHQISDEDLAMNRRIFKLAIEQTCDVNYTRFSPINPQNLAIYDERIEDLLYIGHELYGFAYHLAEVRMIPGTLLLQFNSAGNLLIVRRDNLEGIFSKLILMAKEDFKKGIFDEPGVDDMKTALRNCMNIDYDFAGKQMIYIKKHHSPIGWEFQTIEPGILIQNQINNGASSADATNFFNGLTLNRRNKLPIKEAVYKVNNMERYLFRPILVITENGNERELIGQKKWAESITVLTTNGFQWNKAAEEWKRNACFSRFLDQKSNDHDKLLENQVETILTELKLLYDRNIVTMFDENNRPVNINIPGVGEIDFLWVDPKINLIVVADCKYNRARYDMLSFSADYSNFKQTYENQISNKVTWIEQNKGIVCAHITRIFPSFQINPNRCRVEGLFIINTPTFYMYHGDFKTVCFFRLEEFIRDGYNPPDIVVEEQTKRGIKMKIKKYPYFK